MIKTQKKINLERFRGNGSSIYTGRPQGVAARSDLGLDILDKEENTEVILMVPEGTSSFNPSFYLGMLYNSFKNLGFEKFDERYKFEILGSDAETKKVIQQNLDDGRRNAINELSGKTGLWQFIKSKK